MRRTWPKGWKRPVIRHGKPTKWGWIVLHPAMLQLGREVDIGAFTLINAGAGVLIARGVQIGPHCAILTEDTIGGKKGAIVIGGWACIGAHTVVLPGLWIGHKATVGAHSLVTRDIPEGQTWAGVPARRIK